MIILLMGVTGAGKSTLGRALADALGWPLLEGDDFHPPANVSKMRAGAPLTDADRAPWLAALHAAMREIDHRDGNAVVTCSALKADYRQRLAAGLRALRLVWLDGDRGLLAQRLRARQGHFMPPELLASQLAALEPPADALAVPIGLPTAEQVASIRNALQLGEAS